MIDYSKPFHIKIQNRKEAEQVEAIIKSDGLDCMDPVALQRTFRYCLYVTRTVSWRALSNRIKCQYTASTFIAARNQ